jgi:tRNA (mo5U34)-methyltransferase
MTVDVARARHVLDEFPEWYHSIELADGVVTPGRAPLATWNSQLERLRLPDLTGKSVLDIGAYDGFFSFAAERKNAARVVALDHYVWSCDMAAYMRDRAAATRAGRPIAAPHETTHWRPDELPGRRPFVAVRDLLGSRVEPCVGDFMTIDPARVGRFDIVLFLGVLYHMEDPLAAMRRVFEFTAPGGLAIIETEAVEVPALADGAFCEFFSADQLNHDPTNWWAPNARAFEGLCTAAGFRAVTLRPPTVRPTPAGRLKSKVREALIALRLGTRRFRYRLAAHARR